MNAAAAYSPHNPSAHTISALLSRYYWFIVSFFTTVLMILAMVVDFRRKLWLDELYTLFSANQKSIWDIIKASLEGCDVAPPLYAILVHALLPLIPSEEFAVRLLATLGYSAMVLLTAAFFRRIFSATYALAAVFLICLCTSEWAYEGRAYGLVLGFAGYVLFSWQIMAENRSSAWSRLLFVFSAAMMMALHFQAIFFFAPLFIADLYRSHRGGRMDWKVWIATGAVIAIVLCGHYPIIKGYFKFQQYCWAPALWKYFPVILPLNYRVKYVYLLTIAFFTVAVVLHRRRFAEVARGLLDEYVWMAFLLYFLSPAVIFTLSVYTTKVYLSRYTTWMFIGAGGLAIALFALSVKLSERIGAVLAGLLLVAVMVVPIQKVAENPFGADEALKQIMGLPHDNTPIVVAHHHVFMELYHYAPEQLRHRLAYPLSRDLDIQYLGFDTGALLMDAIRKRYHLPVMNYKDILDRYDRFYVLSVQGHYLPSLLQQDGRHVKLLHGDTWSALYLVWADKSH